MAADPIVRYRKAVERELAAGKATEHSHRPALKSLIEAVGPGVLATNEPKRIKAGAPDFVVSRDSKHGPLTIGYVEAKDVVENLVQSEATEQLSRYRASLSNLVLTNYLEFRWYIDGEERLTTALGRASKSGRVTWSEDGPDAVTSLLRAFLDQKAESVSDPRQLAQRMARLTHMIRDLIVGAFGTKTASETLTDLYRAFEKALIPDLSEPAFADMYAQTIAYGLFAARANHQREKPFRRQGSAAEIPKTNPLLRKLFAVITGPDLDEEPYAPFVDDLAQLLSDTDMDTVLADFGKRTMRDDPVVHFYETFLAAYDPELRETRGVYYTPEPVVSFIVRSVDRLLRTVFGLSRGLADTSRVEDERRGTNGKKHSAKESAPRVLILDPACGTGTFLYQVVDLIRTEFISQGEAGMWSSYVREHLLPRLFGFELLMAPYAVAHLKLGLQLAGRDLPSTRRRKWAYDFSGDERLGIYLTNTLEEAERRAQIEFGFLKALSEEANETIRIKSELPIMVVIGNPPYSGHSANRSWEVREGERVQTFIGRLLRDYYEVDGAPLGERNPKWLQDDYVKFIRFGQWRIEQTGAGILALITNHGYLDNPTFRGMRLSLMRTFDRLYVLNLRGNTKKKESAPDGSKDENVFDIQQGVAIGVFVKESPRPGATRVYYADLWGLREAKYDRLFETDIETTPWSELAPQAPHYLFIPEAMDLRAEYAAGWSLPMVMPIASPGIVTARDHLTIHLSEKELLDTVRDFATMPPEGARSTYDLGPDARDWKVSLAQADLKESGLRKDKVVPLLYRPFDLRVTYFTGRTRGFICMPRHEVMRHMLEGHNIGLITTRQTRDRWDVLVTQHICGHKSCAAYDISSVFPLYLYPKQEDRKSRQRHLLEAPPWPPGKGGRVPNLSPEFVAALERAVGLRFVSDGSGDLKKTVGPEDILHFLYALLQSPTYRSRFSEFLKRNFPRIFLVPDRKLFHALCTRGRELVDIHLLQGTAPDVVGFPEKGSDEVGKVEFRPPASGKKVGSVYINDSQFFEGVLPEVWEFEVGGYQVCEKWLKDRKGRSLSHDEKVHYRKVVTALARTIDLRVEIDSIMTAHGGWPLSGTAPSADYGPPVGKGEERPRLIAEAGPEKA